MAQPWGWQSYGVLGREGISFPTFCSYLVFIYFISRLFLSLATQTIDKYRVHIRYSLSNHRRLAGDGIEVVLSYCLATFSLTFPRILSLS